MLVSCSNPDCDIQYSDSLRACPICSAPRIDRVETPPVNPETHKAVSGVGIFLTVLAGSTFLGAITTAVAGNTIAAIFALVFTFIWGRLAITAFTEKTLR